VIYEVLTTDGEVVNVETRAKLPPVDKIRDWRERSSSQHPVPRTTSGQ